MCIGDTSSRKYIYRHIKTTGNRYRVTCVYKTCIGSILLQSDLNKLKVSQTCFWKISQKISSKCLVKIMKDIYEVYRNEVYYNG